MVLQLEPDGARFRILRPFGYRDPALRRAVHRAEGRGDVPHRPGVDPVVLRLARARARHAPARGAAARRPRRRTDGGQDPHRARRRSRGGRPDPARRDGEPRHAGRAPLADVDGGDPRHAFSTLRPRWRWAPLVVGTLLLVAALGVVATLDLLDVADVLPWMADRPWYVELALGGAVRDRRAAARVGALGPPLAGRRHRRRRAGAAAPRHRGGGRWSMASTGCSSAWSSASEGASPSAKANLEEADTSRGQVPAGGVSRRSGQPAAERLDHAGRLVLALHLDRDRDRGLHAAGDVLDRGDLGAAAHAAARPARGSGSGPCRCRSSRRPTRPAPR